MIHSAGRPSNSPKHWRVSCCTDSSNQLFESSELDTLLDPSAARRLRGRRLFARVVHPAAPAAPGALRRLRRRHRDAAVAVHQRRRRLQPQRLRRSALLSRRRRWLAVLVQREDGIRVGLVLGAVPARRGVPVRVAGLLAVGAVRVGHVRHRRRVDALGARAHGAGGVDAAAAGEGVQLERVVAADPAGDGVADVGLVDGGGLEDGQLAAGGVLLLVEVALRGERVAVVRVVAAAGGAVFGGVGGAHELGHDAGRGATGGLLLGGREGRFGVPVVAVGRHGAFVHAACVAAFAVF